MADCVEIRAYAVGKRTRHGRPVPHEVVPVVTAVTPGAIDRFLGARTRGARIEHLRRLREQGVLIARPGRLQAKVRGYGLAYVFRGTADSVPRCPPTPRGSGGRMCVITF